MAELQARFATHESLHESWLLLSLPPPPEEQAAEISLFLAQDENESVGDQVHESSDMSGAKSAPLDVLLQPRRKDDEVVDIVVPQSFETHLLDCSVEVVDDYAPGAQRDIPLVPKEDATLEEKKEPEPLEVEATEEKLNEEEAISDEANASSDRQTERHDVVERIPMSSVVPLIVPHQVALKINRSEDGRAVRFGRPETTAPDEQDSEMSRLKQQVEDLTARLNKMADLENQISLLRTMLSPADGPTRQQHHQAQHPTSQQHYHGASSEPEDSAPRSVCVELFPPPPPPPPPPPAFTASGSSSSSATGSGEPRPKRSAANAAASAPVELTDAEIEQRIMEEIRLSSKTTAAIAAAIPVFLKSFSRPEHRHLLRKLALDYPFVVRAFPLQPLECVKRMSLWEKHLFRDMDAVAARDLRKRKQVEIITVAIEEIAHACELCKKAEQVRLEKERQEKEVSHQRGNLMSELKGKFDKTAAALEEEQAKLELAALKVADLDGLDL